MILLGAGLTVVIAAALAIGFLVLSPRESAGAPAASSDAAPVAATATPSPTVSGMPSPTTAEVAALQTALASGSDDELRPLVGATPGQALSPDFAAKLKALGIRFDPGSATSTGGGAVWEEDATDASGTPWHVGLVRAPDGHIEISYAERAK